MRHRRFTRIAALAVVSALLVAAAPLATTPVRLGFEGGDDWEPAIAADRYGHVYAFWNHYGDDPACLIARARTWSSRPPTAAALVGTPALLPDATARQDDPQIVVDPVDGRPSTPRS